MRVGTIALACLASACNARRVQMSINPNPIGSSFQASQARTSAGASQGTATLVRSQEALSLTPTITEPTMEKAFGGKFAFDPRAATPAKNYHGPVVGTKVIGAFQQRDASAPSQDTGAVIAPPLPFATPPLVGNVVPTSSGAALATTGGNRITEAEVLECQANWANAIQHISKVHADGGDYVQAAADAAGKLYGYGHSNVLFKPTKAASHPFRPNAAEALSYFVGCDAVDSGYEEDGGFAINGGKGWSNVKFENHQIDLNADTAISMGTYYFTCASTSAVAKVEYTFGYKRNNDGKVRIFLHHSSVPYVAAPAPVTQEEVLAVQRAWSTAIRDISKTYEYGGDYVRAAADAAGELYAYGHSNVLFKPTKAAEHQFRPTAQEAMSYFVGGNAVGGGYAEDTGFAINSGRGWADCVYDNHQIELHGNIGMAMGNYVFTCATTGQKSKVEYTFGYKRCSDGKVRIVLHHSSVPYSIGAAETKDNVAAATAMNLASLYRDEKVVGA